MWITYYNYNTFLIEHENKKLIIDPGGDLYLFNLKSLLPRSLWEGLTHVFVTHGDPDHHWYTDRVARTSGAEVVCNSHMVKAMDGKMLMLGPRDRGLAFTTQIDKLHTMETGETIELDGMEITGVKSVHGPITFKLGPFSKTLRPGPEERIGWGSMGFQIRLGGKRIINLGDSILLEDDWKDIRRPDVLMIPIGGKNHHNTMDELEALKAVDIMEPALVIPCHYNNPDFFYKNKNLSDSQMFKREVEARGSRCVILGKGDSLEV